MDKRIDVHHFGPLREARGRSGEAVTTRAATPRELYDELGLAASYPASALRVAVNDAFAAWDVPLNDGDRVVYIAPTAGG